MSRAILKRLSNLGLDGVTILVVFALLFSIVWLYLTSLKPPEQMFGNPLDIIPKTITLNNFARIWNAVGFQEAFRNSLVVATVTSAIVTTVAFSLSRFRYCLRTMFSLMILGAQLLPGIIVVVPLIITLRRLSLTNGLPGLILSYLPIGLPIAVWMLKSYMDDIPLELDEAALIDGCTYRQALMRVLVPLTAPATVAVAAFVFILAWGEYLFALASITSTEYKTLPLALQAAFGQYTVDWGMLTAGGVIISMPPVILFTIFQRYLVSGLTSGGVKG